MLPALVEQGMIPDVGLGHMVLGLDQVVLAPGPARDMTDGVADQDRDILRVVLAVVLALAPVGDEDIQLEARMRGHGLVHRVGYSKLQAGELLGADMVLQLA